MLHSSRPAGGDIHQELRLGFQTQGPERGPVHKPPMGETRLEEAQGDGQISSPPFVDRISPKSQKKSTVRLGLGYVASSIALWLLVLCVGRGVSVAETDPAGFVLVQVPHHGLAQQTGLGEAVPLLKQRLHNVRDET